MNNKIKKTTEQWEMEVFETSDGRRFTAESQANHWQERIDDREIEKTLIKEKLSSRSFSFGMLDDTWYYVENEIQREYFLRKYARKFQYCYINENVDERDCTINIGDWICQYYELDNEDNDMKIQKGLYTLDYVLSKITSFALGADSTLLKQNFIENIGK